MYLYIERLINEMHIPISFSQIYKDECIIYDKIGYLYNTFNLISINLRRKFNITSSIENFI